MQTQARNDNSEERAHTLRTSLHQPTSPTDGQEPNRREAPNRPWARRRRRQRRRPRSPGGADLTRRLRRQCADRRQLQQRDPPMGGLCYDVHVDARRVHAHRTSSPGEGLRDDDVEHLDRLGKSQHQQRPSVGSASQQRACGNVGVSVSVFVLGRSIRHVGSRQHRAARDISNAQSVDAGLLRGTLRDLLPDIANRFAAVITCRRDSPPRHQRELRATAARSALAHRTAAMYGRLRSFRPQHGP